jgi:hypothetical protein
VRENGFVKIDGKWLKEVTGIENICKLEGTDFTMKEYQKAELKNVI